MTPPNTTEDAIRPFVAAGQLAGAAALIWRDGAAMEVVTVGRRDLTPGLPVERDTIFRLASLTKPVTTVAALSMLDEGRFALDEPIAGCAPELARLRVLRDPEGPLDQCDEATRPITFGDLLTHRSGLTPLGMRDTGFAVPPGGRDRRAGLCGFDDDGRMATLTAAPGGHALAERPDEMTFESGGQGLWSTLDDYLTFARMLIGDGVPGAPVLRAGTLAMMTSNQLTTDQRAGTRLLGLPIFASGHGYGMGVAVVVEPERADPLRCRGGVGNDRVAGRLRQLVAGGSERPIGPDLLLAQYGGAAPDGPRDRLGRVERHRPISRNRDVPVAPVGRLAPAGRADPWPSAATVVHAVALHDSMMA